MRDTINSYKLFHNALCIARNID